MYGPPAAAWHATALQGPRWLVLALAGASLLVLACFMQAGQSGWSVAVLFTLWATCLAFASWSLTRQPADQLRWDGSQWHWSEWPDRPVLHPYCALDLQILLLLDLRGQDGAQRWVWMQAQSMSPQWRAFRRAVLARAASTSATDQLVD